MPVTPGEAGGSLSGRASGARLTVGARVVSAARPVSGVEPAPGTRPAAGVQSAVARPFTRPRRVGLTSWVSIASGAALAAAVLSSPLPTYLLRLLVTFVHELGHSMAGWLFARPAIPTVDFFFGGGVTLMGDRSFPLQALIYLAIAWFGYRRRHNRRLLWLLAAGIPIYTIFVLTTLNTALIIAAGHSAELLLAGFMLYLAMNSHAVRSRLGRMLCAFAGAFVLIGDTRFSYSLYTNASFGQGYRQLGASGFRMDFSRLAEDFLHVDVTAVALAFLIACLLTPLASFLYYRYGGRREQDASPLKGGDVIDITSVIGHSRTSVAGPGDDQVASGRSG